MDWLQAASTVAAAAAGRPQAPAVSASTPVVNSWFDGSGWTVATGKAKATGGARSQESGAGISPLLIAASLVGLLIWKKF